MSDWELQLNRLLPLINADKIMIGQTYPDESDVNERLFVLGTYLLIKGKYTYLNLDTAIGTRMVPRIHDRSRCPIDPLPITLDTYFDSTWQVYVRHYAKGMVLVNPSSTSRHVNLGGTYYRADPIGGGDVWLDGVAPGSLDYTPVTTINLRAHQAAVVLAALPK